MNTRPLSKFESANLAVVNGAGFPSSLIFLTATGLKKSILDATFPLRELLSDQNVHHYLQQSQGPEHKEIVDATLLTETLLLPLKVSLYRPITKQGDPRLWFFSLKSHAQPGDVLVVFVVHAQIHTVNLTRTNLHAGNLHANAATKFLSELRDSSSIVATELLGRLRDLASAGPLRAVRIGDTAIGASVEAALGIPINSSRLPDYKGIELKSGRSKILSRDTRATLFACVPDWASSECKSSAEILSRFGYKRDSQFKLYCTVSADRTNSQGLKLEVDELSRFLREVASSKPYDVAIWKLPHLEDRLLAKHKETFWIKARSERKAGVELFHLQSVIHTRNPNLPQLERLLGDGTVTVDHLIKRTASGGAQEKGPLFKIDRPRIPELFLGVPNEYSLA